MKNMSEDESLVSAVAPTPQEFCQLRNLMGWGVISEQQAKLCIQNSLRCASVYDNGTLVAMGRIVGDGVLFFYLQDIVVRTDYRGCGYGGAVMRNLERYIQQTAKPGASVALLSVKGKEGFYQRYGYQPRDGSEFGFGMCKFIR